MVGTIETKAKLSASTKVVAKKVGENNGQLRFVRHLVWRMQARLDQNIFFYGKRSVNLKICGTVGGGLVGLDQLKLRPN